jgi:hypothetical protein
VWRLEEGLDIDAVSNRLFSTLHSEYLNKETLEEFVDFRIGGQVIYTRTAKYADDLCYWLWKKGCFRA